MPEVSVLKPPAPGATLAKRVHAIVDATPIADMHTHLFAPEFGAKLNLWGVDELLTYHYLVAEYMRAPGALEPREFWKLDTPARADRVWKALFVNSTPLSEAASGIVEILSALGLNPQAPDLREARSYYEPRDLSDHLDHVLKLAGVFEVCMTNDPLDQLEAPTWDRAGRGTGFDRRFRAALRLDRLLNEWPASVPLLQKKGFDVNPALSGKSIGELRRFIDTWIARMNPLYMAVSLPPEWTWPEGGNVREKLLREVILPAYGHYGLPLALMVGVRRQVNPALRLAGDGVGLSDVQALEHLCAEFPDNRFFATYLARENQHALCVAARKFANLMPFGCWWFVNNPPLIGEITRMRIEMLGTTFIPQHSDARVLDQLIYKWRRARTIIAQVLLEGYMRIESNGVTISDEQIRRDAARLLCGNFQEWTQSARGTMS